MTEDMLERIKERVLPNLIGRIAEVRAQRDQLDLVLEELQRTADILKELVRTGDILAGVDLSIQSRDLVGSARAELSGLIKYIDSLLGTAVSSQPTSVIEPVLSKQPLPETEEIRRYGVSPRAAYILRRVFSEDATEGVPHTLEEVLELAYGSDWTQKSVTQGRTMMEDLGGGPDSTIRKMLATAVVNLRHYEDHSLPPGYHSPAAGLIDLYVSIGRRLSEVEDALKEWSVL